jgi:hypothetical protein
MLIFFLEYTLFNPADFYHFNIADNCPTHDPPLKLSLNILKIHGPKFVLPNPILILLLFISFYQCCILGYVMVKNLSVRKKLPQNVQEFINIPPGINPGHLGERVHLPESNMSPTSKHNALLTKQLSFQADGYLLNLASRSPHSGVSSLSSSNSSCSDSLLRTRQSDSSVIPKCGAIEQTKLKTKDSRNFPDLIAHASQSSEVYQKPSEFLPRPRRRSRVNSIYSWVPGEKDHSSFQRRKSTGTIQTSDRKASSRTCVFL